MSSCTDLADTFESFSIPPTLLQKPQVNLPNMAYPHEHRIDVYAQAREGLVELEPDPERRFKYSEFIDWYAKLDDADFIRYREEYLPKSRNREAITGFTQMMIEEGRQMGVRIGGSDLGNPDQKGKISKVSPEFGNLKVSPEFAFRGP